MLFVLVSWKKSLGRRRVVPCTSSEAVALIGSLMTERKPRVTKGRTIVSNVVQRHRQNPQSSNIQVGDIVLIGDDVKKRLQWPSARVIELIPGKDGLVRTVRVQQHSILVRPIQRIFPLEASGSDFQKLLNPPADSSL
ncbi:integrase catalytic domain-containing protein [Trichonephila inaurata madagascariensis]|uniref:Integrase catalytic domain-containing protein n=1 Tax=Trichonephila inaurata madagascariensis TaxID=2747483 RepID=A0A8X6WTP4_9ARAC|nr:integrase catalytic domain-containing protein [Trichonephila inaurata madagascariensis]